VNGQRRPGEEYRNVPVLVLGAAGFIGRWVARSLEQGGADLNLAVRNRPSAEAVFDAYDIRGAVWEADLANLQTVRELLRTVKPAVTFNLAGYGVDRSESDEQAADRINRELVGAVCREIAGAADRKGWHGQQVVHAGSALEYGALDGNLDENADPQPSTLYGRTKLAGTKLLEEIAKARQIRALTARLFTVYGPGEHGGRLLPSLLEAARTCRPLELTAGVQRRDFTYVEDVAEGLLRLGAASARPGEVVNLATGRLTSVGAFARTAATILGIPREGLKFSAIPLRPEEMEHSPVTVERLKRLTGWTPPTSLAEGIRQTLAFVSRAVGESVNGNSLNLRPRSFV